MQHNATHQKTNKTHIICQRSKQASKQTNKQTKDSKCNKAESKQASKIEKNKRLTKTCMHRLNNKKTRTRCCVLFCLFCCLFLRPFVYLFACVFSSLCVCSFVRSCFSFSEIRSRFSESSPWFICCLLENKLLLVKNKTTHTTKLNYDEATH